MTTQLKNNLFSFLYFFSAAPFFPLHGFQACGAHFCPCDKRGSQRRGAGIFSSVCDFCFTTNKSRIADLKASLYTVTSFQKTNSAHRSKTGESPKPLFQIPYTGLIKKQLKTNKPSNKVVATLPKNTNLFCLISISRTKNNTHAVISNLFGENKTKWSISAGQLKLPGGRRKTRLSQRMIYKSCLEKALSFGYKFTVIHCRGTRGSKVRIFRFFGDYLSVLLIKDITGAAHNGCRPPKVRRV